MGLYDRDYTQADFQPGQSHFRYAPQMRFNLPRLTPVVKWLLIINIGIFLAAVLIPSLQYYIYEWFQLDARSVGRALQVWRLITYQFLHDPLFIWHIFFNMLGLFFLGPTLERHWGSRRFLPFYLGCGVAGAAYVFSQSRRDKLKLKLRAGQWEKRAASQRNLQAEVDRILQKVHDSGLQSLTRKEKNTLKEATKAEQMRNRYG
jgi:signal transduction histidine kinase